MIYTSPPSHKNCEIITFVTTYRCNAKCVMCDIWKTKQKFIDFNNHIVDVLLASQNVCENLQTLSLTGGEITLLEPDKIGALVGKFSGNLKNLKKYKSTQTLFPVKKQLK